MINTVSEIWNMVEQYHKWGLSIIPVRDKNEGDYLAKTPYRSWKQSQHTCMSKDRLFTELEEYNTLAVAMIGGKVSGNLEIIDIDEKYMPGISAEFFKQGMILYPDLINRLRVHGTPSMGLHLIYRCVGLVEGNQKLASRNATEQELTKSKQKTYCMIETRGEGGYVLIPPSMGYKVTANMDIPTLTVEERDTIIAFCRSFNQVIKVERISSPERKESNYYQTNPFEDFNERCNPSVLAKDLGWDEYKNNNKFSWFTRPGKSKGVSMSFNYEKRFFYCFTASTELESGKGYTPANLLSLLKFNGDKKQLYAELIRQGYGVINKKVENHLVKKAASNPKIELPANVSQQALNNHSELTAKMQEEYPHGIFWVDSLTDGISIDRELLYKVAFGIGFRLYDNATLVRINDSFIYKFTERGFYDEIKNYIKESDPDVQKDICNAWEIFIERHGKFSISRLQPIDRKAVLADSRKVAFKFYENGILQITNESIELVPYQSTDLLIWHHDIQKRDFVYKPGGKYVEFINLAIGTNINNKKAIGYLSHQYKDETTGYIIVCTESCSNPKDGGGAGKNVFCKLFAHTTTFNGKPGGQVKYDEKFLQSWSGERIFCISDVPKHFDFSFLKELSTGEGLVKKLWKDEYIVPVTDMPKFLIQTNYGIDIKDGGVKRRVIIIEFSDFFTKSGGVDVHFGCFFPAGWSSDDWSGYDTYIAEAIQMWLVDLKIYSAEVSPGMWIKQWEQEFGQVATDFVVTHISDWCTSGWVSNDDFKQQVEKYYSENSTPKMAQPASLKIAGAITKYCSYHNIDFLNSQIKREAYNVVRGKIFIPKAGLPF